MATDIQYRAAAIIVNGILETIDECGTSGAPLSMLYHVLRGIVSQQSFMDSVVNLEREGLIRIKNNIAYPVRGM